MSAEEALTEQLAGERSSWLVTGAAGFIGSHLVEALLGMGQSVVGLDNFATGHRSNLDEVEATVGREAWQRFKFLEGDIRSLDDCRQATDSVDYVLHQAALGSVPRSIEQPILSNQTNVDGFLNMLVASRDAGVKRFVYAASSSTYGDHQRLPKVEDTIGTPLSPYAVTKYVNELYANVFAKTYDMETIGLRYFNVFGPRQDPQGAYAAVIPRWFEALLSGVPCEINGDGETSRDFCYIDNTVQANLLAATCEDAGAVNEIFNVACGGRTTLNELFSIIREQLAEENVDILQAEPVYQEYRAGDVRHSQADIGKAMALLSYQPRFDVVRGLAVTTTWFRAQYNKEQSK